VLSSTERIVPLSVSTQKLSYPSMGEISESLSPISKKILMIDANKLADQAGVPISSNIVMVGALAGCGASGIGRGHFESAIRSILPRMLEENLDAFSKGFSEGQKAAD
jgi:Pyruvate/2-oxoacid:ferredoxin oxidoreductase gamma subunit